MREKGKGNNGILEHFVSGDGGVIDGEMRAGCIIV